MLPSGEAFELPAGLDVFEVELIERYGRWYWRDGAGRCYRARRVELAPVEGMTR
jgi:hypothetical protein